MADINGELTRRFAVKAALGFLESVLAAMGAAGVVQELSADLQRSQVRTLRFGFKNVLRSSADVLEIGKRIWRHRVDQRNALFDPAHRFYLATAVASCDTVSIAADSSQAGAVQLSAEVLALASAHTGVTIARTASDHLEFRGERLVLASNCTSWSMTRRAPTSRSRC